MFTQQISINMFTQQISTNMFTQQISINMFNQQVSIKGSLNKLGKNFYGNLIIGGRPRNAPGGKSLPEMVAHALLPKPKPNHI